MVPVGLCCRDLVGWVSGERKEVGLGPSPLRWKPVVDQASVKGAHGCRHPFHLWALTYPLSVPFLRSLTMGPCMRDATLAFM